MPLTGGLAVNGTSGLLAMRIWAEDTNAKGGLLGRPVNLVYYDDQTTDPAARTIRPERGQPRGGVRGRTLNDRIAQAGVVGNRREDIQRIGDARCRST